MQTLTGSCLCAAGLHSHATHVFEQPACPEGYPCNVVEELVVDDLLKEQTASYPAVCVCAYMYVAEPRTPQHAAFQHARCWGCCLLARFRSRASSPAVPARSICLGLSTSAGEACVMSLVYLSCCGFVHSSSPHFKSKHACKQRASFEPADAETLTYVARLHWQRPSPRHSARPWHLGRVEAAGGSRAGCTTDSSIPHHGLNHQPK